MTVVNIIALLLNFLMINERYFYDDTKLSHFIIAITQIKLYLLVPKVVQQYFSGSVEKEILRLIV